MTAGQPAPRPSGGQLLTPARAQSARRRADLTRAQALLRVTAGRSTIWDILREASMPAGRALLRLSVRQLLLAQPGVGVRTARGQLESLIITLGHPIGATTRAMTLQWLLDPRAGGHRTLAFIDVMGGRPEACPWPGFPFAPPAPTELSAILGAST